MGSKGKAISNGEGSLLRKRKHVDSNKTGSGDRKRIKRKNLQGVLQFIDDAAFEVDENESSDFIDDIVEDEFDSEVQIKNEPGNFPLLPFFPEQDRIDEEEFDKILEEYYKAGSSLITYTEENACENEGSIERSTNMPSAEDPTIWKVKCMVGRERHSAFCLMQKYVDLKSLGTELQIISVFALEHRRGFIFIESYKQCHINEACKGLCNINLSIVSPVPMNELSRLLYVRSKCSEISAGTWARVKNGKYKGDVAQVVALNKSGKKATVKLVPRIDLQALAEKIGRGVGSKKTAIPKPRLISSRELEEFRPLIQYRRDRDVGVVFEVLDGMKFKDGYLYKKVPIDSLIFWGLTLSEDEMLRFEPSVNDESKDLEWLSLLYGDKKAICTTMNDNEGGQEEGSASSVMVNSFEVNDLVLFGRKDFGVIIDTETDDSFKILKEGSEGPLIVTFKAGELKKASFNKKLTALDQHMKVISINDTVRVLEGPLKDRQGVVKQIYRGTVFLYDENEEENNGYLCSKAQTCEKIILSVDGSDTKLAVELEASGTEEILPSPKSPHLLKKRSDNNRKLNRENKDGKFSIGQSLRIRVGPLKGYLCRVMGIQDSNVTVKLDSQHKIITVKGEDLSDVRGRNSAISKREVLRSVKSSSLIGQVGTRARMDGVATSAEGVRCTRAGLSTQWSSQPSFAASCFLRKPESGFENRLNSLDHGLKKGNNVTGNLSSWRGNFNAGNSPMNSWKKTSAGSWNEQLDGGRSSGSKQANVHMKDEVKCRKYPNNVSGMQKNFGRGQGFGGWNKCTMYDKDNAGQQSFGERPITFESVRGGRGGRGLFGVRRSLGWGQPSVLMKRGQQNYGTSEGSAMRNLSSWNGGQMAVGWGRVNKDTAEASDWKGNAGAMGGRSNNFSKRVAFGTDEGSMWRKPGGGSIWDKQFGFNAENQSERWNKPKSFGRGSGFGGRNNGNTEKNRSLERPKPSQRGRGGGLIRGRGGGRGIGNFGRGGSFGRGNVGRGGSFNQGQSLAYGTSDFTASPMGNVKNWNRGGERSGDWGNAKVCGRGEMMMM